MRKTFLLRTADPAEGGTPTPGEVPPAADLVNKSKAKETDAGEIVRLNQALESERSEKKKLAEENAKLKAPPPQPQPEKKKSGLGDWFF
jgi:hypothetical protein